MRFKPRKEDDIKKIIKVKSSSQFKEMVSYSRLVIIGDHIYISDIVGRHPETKEISEDTIE